MTDYVQAVKDLATALGGFHDPGKAYNNRPCLLVVPPTLDFTAGTMAAPQVQWRILALSSYDAGQIEALAELMPLVQHADDVVGVDKATPTQYQLNAGEKRVSAYLCTSTDYL